MRRFLLALILGLLAAGSGQAASTFSGFPAATQPLGNIPDYVPLDQGTGCQTGGSCATVQTPSLRVGQPVQTQSSASCTAYVTPPIGPFANQLCIDNSTSPPQEKIYIGTTWWSLYTLDPSTGPSGNAPVSALSSPFTLGGISVTTTGTQLNYLNAATGTTGSTNTNLVFSGGPTIATPTVTGGTFSSPTITTPSVTGGTFAGSPAITTPTVTGGTFATPAITTPTVTGGTFTGGTFATPTITSPTISGATITSGTLSGITNITQTPTITIGPGDAPLNSAYWIDAIRNGSTSTGNFDNSLVTWIQTETITDTVASRGIDTLYIDHSFGVGEGSRSGLFVNLHNTAATANPSSIHEFYTAIFGNVDVTVNDTMAGGKGEFFGFGGQATLEAGVSIHGIIGAEFDVSAQAGSTVLDKAALQLISYNSDVVKGTNEDTFILIATSSIGSVLSTGIELGKPLVVGSWPFDSTSNLIHARGDVDTPAATAGNGVDFSHVTFTGCAFASKGFCVADGILGLFMQRHFPTITFWDTEIGSPTTNGGVLRLSMAGTSPDVLEFQVNTASDGLFGTATVPLSVKQTGLDFVGALTINTHAGASCTLTTVSHLTVENGIVTLCN